MSLTRSLSTIYEGDDDIDLLEFMQFRKNRDDISDDERDYEREDEEEQENAERVVWPNYGLSGGLMGQGAWARGKAAMVLVLLAKRCG